MSILNSNNYLYCYFPVRNAVYTPIIMGISLDYLEQDKGYSLHHDRGVHYTTLSV